MATRTFKNQAEFDAYLAQNPDVRGTVSRGGQSYRQDPIKKERNFLESLVGSVVDPFVGLGKKGLEATNALSQNKFGDFISGNPNYQTAFLDNEEYSSFKENPLLDTLKDVAGVGATFIPGGAGIKGALKAGAITGGLSSFANSDAKDWRDLDATKIASDAVGGGLLGGGIGLASKGLGALGSKFGGGKIGDALQDAGTSIKGSNLGFKPSSFADDTVQKVVGQLDEMGLPITGANAEMLANKNSQAFRDLLKNKNVKVDFGGEALNKASDFGNLANELGQTATQPINKALNAGKIKNALAQNPELAPFREGIDALEQTLKDTNTGELGQRIGQVSKALKEGRNATKIAGLDNLAMELDAKMPGFGIADATDPADAIDTFMRARDGLKEELQKTYQSVHKGLLNSDPNYAKAFGTSTAQIPQITQKATDGATQTVKNELADFLKTKMNLGDEVASTPALQKRINDNVTRILETEGDPNKIMDVIGSLTNSKNVGEAFLTEKNAITEGTRQFLKNKLQEVAPEAQQFFQQNQPLRAVIDDALKVAQKGNNIPVPFAGGANLQIPGVGALKQNTTNALGGLLQKAGQGANSLSGLGRFIPNQISSQITPANLTKFGVLGMNGMQEGEMPLEGGVASQEGAMTEMGATPQQDPFNGYDRQEVASMYQYLVNNKGGNMSQGEAENYLRLNYGIDLNPQASKATGGATATKLTEGSKKFVSAGNLARQALNSLESGKVSTGKISSVGNKLGEFFGVQSPEQTDYQSKLASARGSAINALAGANVPPSEYERIADMIPTSSDEPQIAKQKLRSFISAMNEYANPDLSNF